MCELCIPKPVWVKKRVFVVRLIQRLHHVHELGRGGCFEFELFAHAIDDIEVVFNAANVALLEPSMCTSRTSDEHLGLMDLQQRVLQCFEKLHAATNEMHVSSLLEPKSCGAPLA